jgi:DNA mismatch repair protein MutH
MAESNDKPADKWTSPRLIVEHAYRLYGRSIKDSVDTFTGLTSSIGTNSKAAFGTTLETVYFGIRPGNSPLPDFPKARLELKSTPLKWQREDLVAKERLVLNKIDFVTEATATFTTSSFFKKCRRILIIAYIHDSERHAVDLEIASIVLFVLDLLPNEDRKLILEDWEIIHSKIAEGKAHEISEGDTRLLAACTKSALGVDRTKQLNGPPAKPRAYSFKQSYLNILLSTGMSSMVRERPPIPYGCGPGFSLPNSADDWPDSFSVSSNLRSFESEIVDRFQPFIGKTLDILYNDYHVNPKAKQANHNLVMAILGRDSRTLQLINASGISIKTVVLQHNGTPTESMSFPAFSFADIVREDWDEIDEDIKHFKNNISKRFLFIVFQRTSKDKKVKNRIFKGIRFWNMPYSDMQTVRLRWEQTKKAVANSDPSMFPMLKDRQVIHVRPHGDDSADIDTLPDGTTLTKRCFWLNALYLKEVLKF